MNVWDTFGPGAFGQEGLFGGMFGGGKGYNDPTKGANKYLDQIQQQLPNYFQPWINRGMNAGEGLQNQYNSLMGDPGAMYNKFAGGYEQSPGFKKQLEQALGGANQAAAAGGMAGSPMAQQWGADISQQMTSRDFENYMNHVLGMYGTGLSGNQGMYNTGFEASRGLGEDMAGVLGSKANLAYQGGAGQNRYNAGQQANQWGMLGALGSFLPFFM